MKIKLLYVEDHELIRNISLMILAKQKWLDLVGVCKNGKEAVTFLSESKLPDVILTDFNMPYFNGIELAKFVQTNKIKTKVVILSTECNNSLKVIAEDAGVTSWLEKNGDFDYVFSEIKSLFAVT